MEQLLNFLSGVFALITCIGPANAADKPVIGVAEFTNQTSAVWWSDSVGGQLSGLLTNELAATKAFTVVDRRKLASVLNEQDLGATGRVSAESATSLGKVTGAQYIVTSAVSAYEENVADTGGGVSYGGFTIGGNKDTAYVAIDLQVIDTTTGEIVDARTVEGTSKRSGFKLGVYKWGADAEKRKASDLFIIKN